MGLYLMSSGTSARLGEPQPHRFAIDRAVAIGHCVVAAVTYKDATEFNGLKVLVYRNVSLTQLRNASKLDPHFLEHSLWPKPFARFEPTEEGFTAAVELATILQK